MIAPSRITPMLIGLGKLFRTDRAAEARIEDRSSRLPKHFITGICGATSEWVQLVTLADLAAELPVELAATIAMREGLMTPGQFSADVLISDKAQAGDGSIVSAERKSRVMGTDPVHLYRARGDSPETKDPNHHADPSERSSNDYRSLSRMSQHVPGALPVTVSSIDQPFSVSTAELRARLEALPPEKQRAVLALAGGLNQARVAELCDISDRTLRRWMEDGEFDILSRQMSTVLGAELVRRALTALFQVIEEDVKRGNGRNIRYFLSRTVFADFETRRRSALAGPTINLNVSQTHARAETQDNISKIWWARVAEVTGADSRHLRNPDTPDTPDT